MKKNKFIGKKFKVTHEAYSNPETFKGMFFDHCMMHNVEGDKTYHYVFIKKNGEKEEIEVEDIHKMKLIK